MKKYFHSTITIMAVVLILVICSSAKAQNKLITKAVNSTATAIRNNQGISTVLNSGMPTEDSSSKAACDTLNYYAYHHSWTLTNYLIGNTQPILDSGFVNGVNVYGDKAKAAYFPNTGGNTYVISGLIDFARAYSSNPAKTITVKVWSVSGGNPGTVLGSQTFTMQQIMTLVNGNYFVNVNFTDPVNVGGSAFFMGVDFSGLNWTTSHDTLGIVSNQNNQTVPSATWEMQSDNLWYKYTTAGSFNLNISLAVFPVMSNSPANASFTQSTTNTCSGYPVTLNASASIQNSVYWVLAGAVPPTSSVVVPTITYATAGTYPIKLYVRGGSCNNLDSMITNITINASPSAPTATSPVTYCQNATATQLTATGSNLLWYTTSTGGTGSTTAPTPSTTSAGTINYYVSQTSGGCESSRKQITVIVNAKPISPTAGSNSPVCTGKILSLTASTIASASYNWTGPNSFTSSQQNPTVSASATSAMSGTYYVTATVNNCASSAGSISVSVVPLPNAYAGHDTTICQGASITLTATGGNTYIWNNGVTQGVSFTPSNNATYTVTVSNGFCTAVDDVIVNVASPPPTPAIYQVGNDLHSTASNGNQWYDDSGQISGATSQIYTPVATGNYYVIVTDANGCISNNSNVIHFVITGVSEFNSTNDLIIYPDPTDGKITLNYMGYKIGKIYKLKIFSINGKLLLFTDLENKTKTIDISEYDANVYFLKLQSEDDVLVKKIIKK